MPKNIVSFGQTVFNLDCKIILDSNITNISRGIAKAFENRKKVIIPNFVKKIEEGAFADLNLKEVVLNEGIERIGSNAFKNSRLEVVTIPNSVKKIGTNAFLAGVWHYYYNGQIFYPSLKEVYYKGNKNNTPWNWKDIGIDINIVKEI